MAKTLYFTNAVATTHRGDNTARLIGTASFWRAYLLDESRGADTTGTLSKTVASVTGSTNGVELFDGTNYIEWLSEPLSADFTIAGTITANLWAFETANANNIAINFLIEKIDGATGALTQIIKSARVTELGTAAVAVNFTATPTSTACKRGDRLRVRIFADDAGTMASGGVMTFYHDRSTAAQGESYLTFTENLTFELAGDPGTYLQDQTLRASTTSMTGPTSYRAQAFTAPNTLTDIRAWLSKTASPIDNVVITIQADSAGVPSGTPIHTIATVTAASLTTTITQYTWTGTWALTAGATYWLVFVRDTSTDAVNFFSVGAASGTVAGWNVGKFFSGTWQDLVGPLTVRLAGTNLVSTYYLTDTAEPTVTSYTERPQFGSGSIGSTTTFTRWAAPFVAPGGTLSEVALWLYKSGSPSDNLVAEIQSDSAGSPSGTVIGTIATIAGSSLTTTFTQYAYSCSISLTGGTKYWLVLRRSGAVDGANFFQLRGAAVASEEGAKTYDGAAWNQQVSGIAWRFQFPTAEKIASTVRGGSSVNAVTNTATGPTAGIQITASAGGTAIEWYTPALNAFTLGGKAKFNVRALESLSTANASIKAEIAVTNNDGSGATVWGSSIMAPLAGATGEISLTDTAWIVWVAGDDVAITAGQRLRFRIYSDDSAGQSMVSGQTVTVSYAGTSAAAAGDTYVILPQAVTEQVLVTQLPDIISLKRYPDLVVAQTSRW